jgi:hypothetical protein
MSGGMDQFLANRLTQLGKMQVVADPQNADTILTDRIGEPFEKRLDLIYGARNKKNSETTGVTAAAAEDQTATDQEMPAKTDDSKDAAKDGTKDVATKDVAKDATKDKTSREEAREKAINDAKLKIAQEKADEENAQALRVSSFGRGRGTYFLVDRKTRGVIWSVYEKPKSTSADELNKTAERVVNRLKRDLKPPAVSQN